MIQHNAVDQAGRWIYDRRFCIVERESTRNYNSDARLIHKKPLFSLLYSLQFSSATVESTAAAEQNGIIKNHFFLTTFN